MAKSRLDMRREAEAAEAMEEAAPAKKKAKKKKAAKKKSTTARSRKKKADTPARRRLIWVLYSSTMREEGRYLYHERDKAEEKLQSLLAKGKRRYFLQPIKEPLDSEGNPMVPDEAEAKPKKSRAKAEPEAEAPETEEPEVEADAEAAGIEGEDEVEPVEPGDDE